MPFLLAIFFNTRHSVYFHSFRVDMRRRIRIRTTCCVVYPHGDVHNWDICGMYVFGGKMVNMKRERIIEEKLLSGCTDDEIREATSAPLDMIRALRARLRKDGRDVEPDLGPLF